MNGQPSRRQLFVTGGLGLIAAAAVSTPAAAKALSAAEQANVKLVKDFLAGWNDKDLDLDKFMARYFAPKAVIRLADDMPAVIGPVAAAIQTKAGLPPTGRVAIKIHEIFAHGPVVATARTDTMTIPGQPDQIFKVAGVHIVKDGLIQEYTDYILS